MPARSLLPTALCVLFVAPSLVRAQVPADLQAAMRARNVALAQADAATWDRLTADNFTLIVPSGKVLTKAERLPQIKAQQPTAPVSLRNETVQVSGTLAVQRFQVGDSWVSQVWKKDRAGWRVNAVQVTAIEPDSAAVRKAIESNNARFLEALQRGDTAAVAASYTPDGVVMISNQPAWTGRSAIGQGFSGFFAQFSVVNPRLVTRDIIVSGDYAIERGTYEWTLHPKTGTGTDMMDNGKYLTVWERQADGSWKIARDISNSDRSGAM
jgi:uncharacterized protein (TIGR02246 family)